MKTQLMRWYYLRRIQARRGHTPTPPPPPPPPSSQNTYFSVLALYTGNL